MAVYRKLYNPHKRTCYSVFNLQYYYIRIFFDIEVIDEINVDLWSLLTSLICLIINTELNYLLFWEIKS